MPQGAPLEGVAPPVRSAQARLRRRHLHRRQVIGASRYSRGVSLRVLPPARTFAALALALAGALAPSAASADEPVTLGSSDVVDAAGVVGDDLPAVEEALETLYDDTGIQLVVVYVDSFTGASTPAAWAERTAEINGLGTNDVLLAVAVTERNYVTWYPEDFELSAATTVKVEQDDIEPELRDNDWAGAAIAAADGLGRASEGFNWLPVIGGAAAIGAGAWGFSAVRKRRTTAAERRESRARLEQLEREASVALITLDDELITSRQELDFAAAQFGDEATRQFRVALEEARSKAMRSFELKKQLDDSVEETAAERIELAESIIAFAAEGDAILDAQAAAFAELRELEKNAPEVLARAEGEVTALTDRIEASARLVDELQQRYAPPAVAAVADNPAQARSLLEFATEARDGATAAIAAGRTSDAAVQVRSLQAALAQATQLVDAAEALSGQLEEAAGALTAAIRDTGEDLASARTLSGDARLGSTAETLARAVSAAEAALAAASSAEGQSHPVSSLATLTAADVELDRILAAARQQSEQVLRAVQQLPGTIARAESSIRQASSFIETRRGAVRERARSTLAQAERHLAAATEAAAVDPAGALTTALSAATTADSALASAQADVRAQQQPGGYGYTAGGGGQAGYGADLGGLLGQLVFGGSSSRGSSWGASYGGGSYRGGRSASTGRSSSSRSRGSSRSSGRSRGSSSRGRTGGGRF